MHSVKPIECEKEALTLGHFLKQPGDKLAWCYDIGDRWRHTLKVSSSVKPASQALHGCHALAVIGRDLLVQLVVNCELMFLVQWPRVHRLASKLLSQCCGQQVSSHAHTPSHLCCMLI